MNETRPTKVRLLGVAALCVLSGSGWLLRQAWPCEIAWASAGCIHYALIGFVGIGLFAKGDGRKRDATRRLPALGLAGLFLLVVPTVTLEYVAGKVPEFTSVVIFCAVPLMTVVAAASFGIEAANGLRLRGLMAPSVIGLGGALLLFPISDPGSLRRWLYLGLVLGVCAVVAAAGMWMHRLMQGIEVAAAVSIVGLCSSAVLGLYELSRGWPQIGARLIFGELLRCAVLDLPVVWLLVWLMREVTPSRLAARFLLVPIVTVVEGYAVEHGALEARVVLAVTLLCGGGLTMLLRDEPEEIAVLRLR